MKFSAKLRFYFHICKGFLGKVIEKVSVVARKHMKKNTQVVQFANSSGSIKQLK